MVEARPFRLFGPDHLAALAVVAALSGLLMACRPWLGPGARRLLGWSLAAGLSLFAACTYWSLWRCGNLTWDYALPLHLCNVLTVLAVVTLLRPTAWGAELVYYWGVGGTAHALVTPDLVVGFPSWEYLHFFCGHGLLVVAVVHLVGVLGLHPRRGGAWRALAAFLLWVAVVGSLDRIFGWNYGYLCARPVGASVLDHLGPWPWYVLAGILLAALSFGLLSLPWPA